MCSCSDGTRPPLRDMIPQPANQHPSLFHFSERLFFSSSLRNYTSRWIRLLSNSKSPSGHKLKVTTVIAFRVVELPCQHGMPKSLNQNWRSYHYRIRGNSARVRGHFFYVTTAKTREAEFRTWSASTMTIWVQHKESSPI
jgi:hypothetical protein